MFDVIRTRLQQKHRTMLFPDGPAPELPERFAGIPAFSALSCPPHCRICADICPTHAIDRDSDFQLDLGRCIFCRECENACPAHRIQFAADYRMGVRKRGDLICHGTNIQWARPLDAELKRMFGRSLKLRQVSAGGCNACEADVNVLNTVGWDLGRFGIQFVASPRHADGLLVTGPVTRNMHEALQKTYDAVPAPKIVIAVGACAISGGIYEGHDETMAGVSNLLPVDLWIPGCPPHPLTILDGLLRLIGRIEIV